MAAPIGTVYALHLEPPLHHAAHYIGWTVDSDPARRIAEHLAGTGSPLIRAAVAAGRTVALVLSVAGDRGLERRWHNRHGTRVCPCCTSQRAPRPRQDPLPVPRRQPASSRRGAGTRPRWRFAQSRRHGAERVPGGGRRPDGRPGLVRRALRRGARGTAAPAPGHGGLSS